MASPNEPEDDFDVDQFLRLEADSYAREREVERLLAIVDVADKAPPSGSTSETLQTPNPLIVLDLAPAAFVDLIIDPAAVRTAFRKKSLLVHPDKCPHPRADIAFQAIKAAEKALADPEERARRLNTVRLARDRVFRELGLTVPPPPPSASDAPDAATAAAATPPVRPTGHATPAIAARVRATLTALADDLLARDALRYKNETLRQQQRDAEAARERQRQAQHAKSWEGQRDTRIQSWRAFTQRQDRRSSVATRGGGGGGGGGGGSASSRREPSAGQSSLDADGPRRGSRPSSGPPSGPPSAPASGARASPPLNPRSRPGGPMATPPAKKRQRPSSIPLLG